MPFKKHFLPADFLFCLLSLAYLCVALWLIKDYGLVYDSVKNIDEGRVNLQYLLHGGPLSAFQEITVGYQIHGSFFFMVMELLSGLLSPVWKDPAASRHILLPLLTVLFLVFFYRALRKQQGGFYALAAVCLLLSTPRFFGSTFNFAKDIPLFVFCSGALFFFYEFMETGGKNWKLFHASGLCLGLALLAKLYALVVPLILILWLGSLYFWRLPFPSGAGFPQVDRRKLFLHAGLSLVVISALGLLFYAPAFLGIEAKGKMLEFKYDIIFRPHIGASVQPWNLYALKAILLTLPLGGLMAFCAGIFWLIWKKTRTAWDALIALWLIVPLLLPSTSYLRAYDGIRLFMIFFVPYAVLGASGLAAVSEVFKKWFPRVRLPVFFLLVAAVTGSQVWAVAATHPDQSLYFNALTGGLRGAQARDTLYAYDYTFSSHRRAAQWANVHLPPDAVLMVTSPTSQVLLQYAGLRPDIRCVTIQENHLPNAGGFVLMPFITGKSNKYTVGKIRLDDIRKVLKSARPIYTLKSHGGRLLEIYFMNS